MEVSDQIHTLDTLPQQIMPPCTHSLGGCLDPRGDLGTLEKRHLLQPLGIEPRFCGYRDTLLTMLSSLYVEYKATKFPSDTQKMEIIHTEILTCLVILYARPYSVQNL